MNQAEEMQLASEHLQSQERDGVCVCSALLALVSLTFWETRLL